MYLFKHVSTIKSWQALLVGIGLAILGYILNPFTLITEGMIKQQIWFYTARSIVTVARLTLLFASGVFIGVGCFKVFNK